MNLAIYIKRLPLWVYVLLPGLITFYTYEIKISSDMGWYMNSALNIFMGKGYTNMDGSVILNRGPVFPLMIASSYWLLGVSAWTAFWVVRIFCILNPIIIYFFGKRFFGKWVGFSASLLILTSYGMNFWSYRHIDAVWPFFTLVSILTIHLALENERYIYFVLSGILMGLAYLVKQAAILFLPLPLILTTVIGDYRRKKNLVGSIIFILTIFAFISPWLDYAYSHGKNIELALFGEVGRDESETTVNADILVFAKDYLLGLLAYYDKGSNSLSSNFSIAPLFICAWLFTIYRAIRGEKASVFFTVFLLLLSPYIAFVGLNNMRVGQLVIFLLITYLVTAGFCLAIMGKAAAANYGRLRISRKLIGYATGLVVIGLVVIQTFISNKKDKGNKVFFKRSYVYQSIIDESVSSKVIGGYTEVDRACGEWIQSNFPLGSRLMVSKPSEGKGIYFYSGGKFPMFVMPVIQSNRLSALGKRKADDIVFMSSWIAQDDPKNKIYVLTGGDLYRSIKENRVEYVVVSRKRNYLSLYFDNNGNFEKIKEFGAGRVRIYKVRRTSEKCVCNTLVSERLIAYLRGLERTNAKRFDWYVNEFFEGLLGWDYGRVREIMNCGRGKRPERCRVVRTGKIYS